MRSDLQNGVHVDEDTAAPRPGGPASNDYENLEQGGPTRIGKVEIDRHRSVRSEICVSPTWSKTAKKRSRRRERKQQEKEQKDLDKKLKREVMGKPREPRRLTKTQPGYHSSRASSAHSGFARFSTAGSIRSFWSNRTSRASSIHDAEDRGRDTSRRNSMSSQADGVTKPYKFLGIFPRRSGAAGPQDRNQTVGNDPLQPEAPARTLHTTRKNADLRASARADDRRAPVVESPQTEGISHPKANGHVTSNSTDDTQLKKSKYKRPSKHKPDLPVFHGSGPITQPEKEFRNISREMYLESQTRLKDNSKDAAATIRPPASHTPARRHPHGATIDQENHDVDKPGDFSGPSLSKRSPLETIVANAASIIKAEEDSVTQQNPSPPLEPSPDRVSKDAAKERPVNTRPASTSSDVPEQQAQIEGVSKDEPDGIRAVEPPSETPKQQEPIPEDVTKDETNNVPVIETPSDGPKNAQVAQYEAGPNSTEQIPGSSSEPAPSLPTESLSSNVNKEKDQEQKDHESLRKPVMPQSRDSRFQSSPLAAPPLVVQSPENAKRDAKPEVEQDVETDKNEEPRRPAKLRRRSASSARSEVPSQHQSSYFARFWRAGKKERKAKEGSEKDSNEQQNGNDEEESNIREGKRPAHAVNHSAGGPDNVASSQNDAAQDHTAKGLNTAGAAAPSLPRRSTAPDGSIPTHSRRTASDIPAQPRPLTTNAEPGKRPFSVDSPSKEMFGSAPARNSTATLTLRDLMDDPTMTAATAVKGSHPTKPDQDRLVGSSNMLSVGSTGQRSQRTGFHQGQRVAKMFVICCQCKFWHDMPSEAYSNLNFPQPGGSGPQTDGGTPSQTKPEENGRKPDKLGSNNDIINDVQPESSSDNATTGATRNNATLKPKDDSKPSTRPTSSSSGLTLKTSASCCWCSHRMTRSCCAGWTAVVNLHERHH